MRVNCGLWWPTFGVHVNDNDCNQSYYFLCVSKLTHPESVVWHIRMVLQRKKHWLCHTCTSCSYQSGGAIPLDMRQTWKRQTYISGIHSSTVKTTPQLLQAMSEVTVAFVGIMHMNLNSDASDVVELVHSNKLTTFLRNTIVESADKCWSKLQIHTSEFARKRKQKKKSTLHFVVFGNANCFRTIFMSMPLVYVQACWKYSSNLCLSGFGIWWKRMNSFTLSIWRWYRAVPEYNLWMMADTFPKMLAYIRAGRDARQTGECWGGAADSSVLKKVFILSFYP